MAGKFHMAANRFLVWRAATSVNWMTTAKDIARETGIHHDTVYRIINAAGCKHRLPVTLMNPRHGKSMLTCSESLDLIQIHG